MALKRFPWLPSEEVEPPATKAPHIGTGLKVGAPQQARVLLPFLHSVYENCKLNVLCWSMLPSLGATLYTLAVAAEAGDLARQYQVDLGRSLDPYLLPTLPPNAPLQASSLPVVASIFKCLEAEMMGGTSANELPELISQGASLSVQRSVDIMHCLRLLSNAMKPSAPNCQLDAQQVHAAVSSAARDIALYLAARGWSSADLDTLPLGVSLPFHQLLAICSTQPEPNWPAEVYSLIGRQFS